MNEPDLRTEIGAEMANLATRIVDESVIAKDAPAIRSVLFRHEFERNQAAADIVLDLVVQCARRRGDSYLEKSLTGQVSKSYYLQERTRALRAFAKELEALEQEEE